MLKTMKRLLTIVLINILVLIALSEIVFTAYYYAKDGRYISVGEKLAAEKSSFEVEKSGSQPCNKHKRVLSPHPYLVFTNTSRPECNAPANNSGHRGPDIPLAKSSDQYVVMWLGGSVANQIYQLRHTDIEAYFRSKHPGKKILLLNGSLEAWKQPQQLFMLQMYGDVIDEAISLEGYNEMMFNYRLEYRTRFETPFLPAYRKANSSLLTETERDAIDRSATLFDMVNNSTVLRHSKAAYFILDKTRAGMETRIAREKDLESLQTGTLRHLGPVFLLPEGWSHERRREHHIQQYHKYLQLMQSTARQYNIRLTVFLQPVPALDKTLTEDEKRVTGDLGYAEDYLLFSRTLLNDKSLRTYSLLDVFAANTETIYRDGIHYEENSAGCSLVVQRILDSLDTRR